MRKREVIFPEEVFPEEIFPTSVFPPEVFPRSTSQDKIKDMYKELYDEPNKADRRE